MSDVLVFEFATPEAVHIYEQVNKLIGLDPVAGTGDWPDGMLSHLAGGEGESIGEVVHGRDLDDVPDLVLAQPD